MFFTTEAISYAHSTWHCRSYEFFPLWNTDSCWSSVSWCSCSLNPFGVVLFLALGKFITCIHWSVVSCRLERVLCRPPELSLYIAPTCLVFCSAKSSPFRLSVLPASSPELREATQLFLVALLSRKWAGNEWAIMFVSNLRTCCPALISSVQKPLFMYFVLFFRYPILTRSENLTFTIYTNFYFHDSVFFACLSSSMLGFHETKAMLNGNPGFWGKKEQGVNNVKQKIEQDVLHWVPSTCEALCLVPLRY